MSDQPMSAEMLAVSLAAALAEALAAALAVSLLAGVSDPKSWASMSWASMRLAAMLLGSALQSWWEKSLTVETARPRQSSTHCLGRIKE